MIILIGFAFLAGVITILSPCILPILPIVLSGSFGSKRRPLGIVTGFVLSFTIFTLFLTSIVKLTGIPSDVLRNISIIILLVFGFSLILPQFQTFMEKLFSGLQNRFAIRGTHEGFHGGLLIGFSLGLVWTPCVGPIIASVITLAATANVNLAAIAITFAYALGTAIPMLAIMLGGRALLQRIPWLLPNSAKIQKVFGILMILTAIAIYFSVDRKFQVYILDKFPNYGTNLTSLEDNSSVKNQLDNVFNKSASEDTGKPMSEFLDNFGNAPEIIPGGVWFNSEPQRLADLRGKVILIDFWTYSCINCIRTLPYLKDWHEKYSNDGLVIIGVHSPEFEFEKDVNNLKKAIDDFGLKYPIVQDNDFATWNAYNNRYWPAKYLIDKDGKIRYYHFGEGEYETTEKKIQELLKDSGKKINEDIRKANYKPNRNITPETYLGNWRMEYFYPEGNLPIGENNFTLRTNLPENYFSLGGKWIVMDKYSKSISNGVLEQNFRAQNVFLVMRSSDGKPKKVKVFLDGKSPGPNSGKDIKNGELTVESDRLYDLINLPNVENRKIKLEFENDVEIFAFTFG